jgi:hypothetical protein
MARSVGINASAGVNVGGGPSPAPSGPRPKRTGRGGGAWKLQGRQQDVYALWLLLGLEVGAMAALRHWSRHFHGG